MAQEQSSATMEIQMTMTTVETAVWMPNAVMEWFGAMEQAQKNVMMEIQMKVITA